MMTNRPGRSSSFAFSWLILFFCFPGGLFAQQTYIVNDSSDPGTGGCTFSECTFREALEAANSDAAVDTILFDIAGAGAHTITPVTALPGIEQTVVIDGYSQPGALPARMDTTATLLIELNGENAPADAFGLDVRANDVEIYGLVINRFALTGIVFDGVMGGIVSGCYIGVDLAGEVALPNGDRDADGIAYDGIWIFQSAQILIGGDQPAHRNVISGNAFSGIYISEGRATENSIAGNYIGTDATGMTAIGNAEVGIFLQNSPGNQIGGSQPGEGNLISGNGLEGIVLLDVIDIEGTAGQTTIQGNWIGLNAAGSGALPNEDAGIAVLTSDNLIGGDSVSARNVISGNGSFGILVAELPDERQASGNILQGNYVGPDVVGMTGIGNGSHGIQIEEASDNTIANNLVGASAFAGIRIIDTNNGDDIPANNIISGNIIGLTSDREGLIPNGEDGIALNGGENNQVGGDQEGDSNFISGNTFAGIYITDGAQFNRVEGNRIGLYPLDGSGGNQDAGIDLFMANDNTIGGVTMGKGNLIAFNQLAGINSTLVRPEGKRASRAGHQYYQRTSLLHAKKPKSRATFGAVSSKPAPDAIAPAMAFLQPPGEGNAIWGNDIFFNGGLPIDLNQDGRTINDADDADGGANKSQNYPDIIEAVIVDTTLSINYQVASATTHSMYPLTIEFYFNTENGGPWLIGRDTYEATDAQSSKTVSLELETAVFSTDFNGLLATATDADGNTSEYSDLVGVSFEVANEDEPDLPASYELFPNYPNPFNPTTHITYTVPTLSTIGITLHDVLGREVKTLVYGPHQAGLHRITFDASDLSSGVYFYRMQADNFIATRSLTITK